MVDVSLILNLEVVVYRKAQAGVFMIELAIVLVFLSGIFVMLINHLMAFNKKAQLDRAAYSLVTIISERKQLFENDLQLCSNTESCNVVAKNAFKMVSYSLARMNSTFDVNKLGMRIDQVSMKTSFSSKGKPQYTLENNLPIYYGATAQCDFPGVDDMSLSKAEKLLPVAKSNNYQRIPLYQVSLCYKVPLDLIGVTSGEVLRLISTSYSFARF